MADQGRDAQRRCRQPDAARSARDPGRHLHRLSAGWLLGRVGRRLGLYPAKFPDRRCARRALRPFWRAVLDDCGLLRREPGCHRTDPSFVLPPSQARYGGLAAMGHCGCLPCRHNLARGRGRDPFHHFRDCRHRVLRLAAARPYTAAPGAAGACAARHRHEGGKLRYSRQVARLLSQSRKPHFRQRSRHRALSRKGAGATDGLAQRTRVSGGSGGGMISPGPVVITATFVGYLVAGFWGSLVSTVGIFLQSFLLILIVAPILVRHRANPNVEGFVKGAYAAAIGTILGACVLLGKLAIGDWLTVLVGLGSLAVLFRFKVSNPLLIAATAVIGLVAFPLLQPGWVYVK